MINAQILLDSEGILKSCTISGHAGLALAGRDVVCAAVSVLARTAAAVFQSKNGISVKIAAPKRGEFALDVHRGDEDRGFVEAAGGFLIEGLKSIAAEYPDHCMVTIR
ncbi:MAG: hypothetical protein Ta2G_09480 [Termitinemataceae bacterium]|nr:MAG: hypothetical protein Ta2G_09480 [Termitinemataceae bacterium]